MTGSTRSRPKPPGRACGIEIDCAPQSGEANGTLLAGAICEGADEAVQALKALLEGLSPGPAPALGGGELHDRSTRADAVRRVTAPFHDPNENPTLAMERDLALIEHGDGLGSSRRWVIAAAVIGCSLSANVGWRPSPYSGASSAVTVTLPSRKQGILARVSQRSRITRSGDCYAL